MRFLLGNVPLHSKRLSIKCLATVKCTAIDSCPVLYSVQCGAIVNAYHKNEERYSIRSAIIDGPVYEEHVGRDLPPAV